jgi:hypothetical protein
LGEGKGHSRSSKETNDVSLGSAQDRGGSEGEMGESQAREESGLKTGGDRLTCPAGWRFNCPLEIQILSALLLEHTYCLCFDAPIPSVQVSFGIRQVRCLTPSQAAQRNSGT